MIAGSLTYVKSALPDVGVAEDINIESTPEALNVALANSVCVCMDCHSTRDWSKFSGPLTEGTLGNGGERFDQAQGLPDEDQSSIFTYLQTLNPIANEVIIYSAAAPQ